jgi:hypothetical protein
MRVRTEKQVRVRIIALSLLVYSCAFILDDSPFTSCPQIQADEILCIEEQEESLAIITFIKTSFRSAAPRPHLTAGTFLSQSIQLRQSNSSLQLHSTLARLSSFRDRSVSYCIFKI